MAQKKSMKAEKDPKAAPEKTAEKPQPESSPAPGTKKIGKNVVNPHPMGIKDQF